jgi:ankyrin repeat protein
MSELRRAIEEHDVAKAWELLGEPQDVNLPLEADDGLTALHLSAAEGIEQLVYALILCYGADVNLPDAQGLTALHHAAVGGHGGIVSLLLNHGANVALEDHGRLTPLCLALDSGHIEIAELLISRGSKPTEPDTEGNTLLHVAARNNWVEVVRLLLARDNDAPPYSWRSRQCDARNANGDTPLHLAVEASAPEVVSLLVGAGADPWAVNSAGEKPIMVARKRDDQAIRWAIACPTRISQRTAKPPTPRTYSIKDRRR